MARKYKRKMAKSMGTLRRLALRAGPSRGLFFRPTGVFRVNQLALIATVNGSNSGYTAGTASADSTIRQSSTLPLFGAMVFQLSDLVQSTAFTALFDQYRIAKVSVTFAPSSNFSGLTGNAGVYTPTLYVVKDYDDAVAPTSLNDLRQYQNCREASNYRKTTIVLKPKVAAAVYGGGAFTSYASMTNQWIDCASPSVEHYGVKYALPPSTAGSLQQYSIVARYSLEFKNVR